MGGAVSECDGDKLGTANIEHIETICSARLEVVCGKETGPSVGNSRLLIPS